MVQEKVATTKMQRIKKKKYSVVLDSKTSVIVYRFRGISI